MKRPFAVTLLAIIAILAGIMNVVDVFRYLGLLPIVALGELTFFSVSFLGAIFAGILALIWFSVARQLWNLDAQGWMFVVVVGIFNVIVMLLSWMGGADFSAVWPSLSISAVALILAFLPGSRAAFGQR